MADLMNGTWTYEKLYSTYQQFMVPAMRIKINGKDVLSKLQLGVTQVDVSLSLESSSSVSLQLAGGYDAKNRAFKSQVSSNVRLGAIISVELGYGSSLEEVFYGFIYELSYQFSDIPMISVTAFDVRRLMMNNSRIAYSYDATNCSDIVTTILKTYSSMIEKRDIDTTTDSKKTKIQEGSDYDFIAKELATESDREFFVFGRSAYFRKPQKSKQAMLTLEWGKSLISFNSNFVYSLEKMVFRGRDLDAAKAITAEKSIQSVDEIKQPLNKPTIKEITDTNITSKEEADKVLASKNDDALQKDRQASGSCIGLPVLVPGRFIKIKGLDKTLDKTYYLTQVKHSFSDGGFQTQFDIGGWI